jgi:group I intron endonuclease
MQGIYRITNTVTGRVYIGSSYKSTETRMRQHLYYLCKGTHSNYRMQEEWNTFGKDAFIFEHLITFTGSHDELLSLEQSEINRALPHAYNILVEVRKNPMFNSEVRKKHKEHYTDEVKTMMAKRVKESWTAERKEKWLATMKEYWAIEENREKIRQKLKGRVVSSETRKKIGEASKSRKHSDESKRKIGDASRNRKFSEESRKKMSETRKGRRHSEETKRKIAEANRRRKGKKKSSSNVNVPPIDSTL